MPPTADGMSGFLPLFQTAIASLESRIREAERSVTTVQTELAGLQRNKCEVHGTQMTELFASRNDLAMKLELLRSQLQGLDKSVTELHNLMAKLDEVGDQIKDVDISEIAALVKSLADSHTEEKKNSREWKMLVWGVIVGPFVAAVLSGVVVWYVTSSHEQAKKTDAVAVPKTP